MCVCVCVYIYIFIKLGRPWLRREDNRMDLREIEWGF
jgi:hypothetical protein